MTLGTALFASVVLILVVYHEKFRKVFLWIAGVAAVAIGMFFLSSHLYTIYEEHKHKQTGLQIVKSQPLPGPTVVEIHGGETLKIVDTVPPAPLGFLPLVYLGHKQEFSITCGNYGEQGTPVVFDKKKESVSCP